MSYWYRQSFWFFATIVFDISSLQCSSCACFVSKSSIGNSQKGFSFLPQSRQIDHREFSFSTWKFANLSVFPSKATKLSVQRKNNDLSLEIFLHMCRDEILFEDIPGTQLPLSWAKITEMNLFEQIWFPTGLEPVSCLERRTSCIRFIKPTSRLKDRKNRKTLIKPGFEQWQNNDDPTHTALSTRQLSPSSEIPGLSVVLMFFNAVSSIRIQIKGFRRGAKKSL